MVEYGGYLGDIEESVDFNDEELFIEFDVIVWNVIEKMEEDVEIYSVISNSGIVQVRGLFVEFQVGDGFVVLLLVNEV